MKKATQKIHATTQKFTEIIDIIDNIVLLDGGSACLVIELTASNFALLSKKEQDARIYAYAALLNSLTFPMQVIIRNKRIDISSYLKNLEEAEKNTSNPLLAMHIKLYHDFVKEMVRVNVVLNKTFYIAIHYSALESGIGGVKQTAKKTKTATPEQDISFQAAKKALDAKAESVHTQLAKLTVAAKTLEKDELIKLFYDIYNDGNVEITQITESVTAPFVRTTPKQ